MDTLDENKLAVVVAIGLLIGIIVIRAIIKSIFNAKPPATFRCARCRREVSHHVLGSQNVRNRMVESVEYSGKLDT